eukprot:TRINITY_DN5081_c0_g1_i1.p1 TRINITY_DN5081_c0_g1~~TRINITY_DN5081_c0_g1_i1.p1  ORF type:complete len:661 (+),score=160.82 TRINITY_DN5081_c0_g1_i1:245-2227(+)
MDETLIDTSIRRRLIMQNEVLKWLEDFSEKMEKRANDATLELHELLDQTGVVEQDLKNTFNAFRNLSHSQFIENKVSEEDDMTGHAKEATKDSVHAGVPAQSYEVDILPRYKEALSLGLSSYKHHLQKSNRGSSSGSLFKFGLACGPLPHIIGSEEFLHDNSCGLATDDFILESEPLDFGPKAGPDVHSNAGGSRAMLNADLFGIEKDPSEKEGNEPLVSAALDFKAMLEAALLSPYKFYDNESSSLPDAVGGQNDNVEDMRAKMDYISSTASSPIAVARSNDSRRASSIEDSSVPSAAGSVTFLPQADNNTQKLCSALLSESLFDTEEDFLSSNQMKCAQIPASTEESYGSECTEVADDVKLPGNSAGLSIQESEVILSRNGKVIVHEELLLEVGDNSEFFSSDRSHFSLHDEGTSLTSAGSENKSEKSVKPSQYDSSLINKVSEEEKISGSSSATLGDSFSNTENKISAGQIVDQSLPVTSKVVNDSDIDEENCPSEHLPKPVPSLSGSCPESSSMKSCTESSSAVPGESITKSRIEKPIINDIPGRADPMFSTVVSVSPELGSLSSSTTLSRTRDLDTWSGSSEENPNSSDATIEESTKTTESCNTAELTPELSQTSEAIGRPSVLEVGDDLEAGSSIHECSDAGENSNGEPCIVIE